LKSRSIVPVNSVIGAQLPTVVSYLSVLKHISSEMGTIACPSEAFGVQEWLRTMQSAQRQKACKALMIRFLKRMLWEMWMSTESDAACGGLGISKRLKKPLVLTVEQYCRFWLLL